MPTNRALIGLGANMGNRAANLARALRAVEADDCRVVTCSALYETTPVGGPPGQTRYLNACAWIETTLQPRRFQHRLHQIERLLGRRRAVRWGPRPIDLDLLLWNEELIHEPDLVVPHPWLPVRRFVLEPLAEIAPEVKHPVGWSVAEQLDRLNRNPRYIALTGPLGVGKTTVATEFARRTGALFVQEVFDEEELARVYRGDRQAAQRVQDWFARSRQRLLAADKLERRMAGSGLIISDFWFGQSEAYARVELDPTTCWCHRELLRTLGTTVYEPTIVVLLDAEPRELSRRVQRRGRAAEATVGEQFLAELRHAFHELLRQPGAPPSITIHAMDTDAVLEELFLVLASMG